MTQRPPSSDLDLWTDEALRFPFPAYRVLRDLAPVVHLQRHDLYAVTRYRDVRSVLEDWKAYSSAQGVGFNVPMNEVIAGSLVGSDPPRHTHYRAILQRPLSAMDMKVIRERIRELAAGLVARLLHQDSVEVVSELASYLPITLVAELVGLPPEGRERMLEWAAGAFNAIAPLGVARVAEGMESMAGMRDYFGDPALPGRVRPDSWADRLQRAVQANEITAEEFSAFLSVNYVVPALDTTIHATSNMLWLLAEDPERWKDLRNNRGLVGRAVHEILRLEGPVQAFSRVATHDADIDGYRVEAGQRLLVCYASANRDERHYADPDRFDLRRNATDHLAFGFAEHVCLGRNLAILELTMVLTELLSQVERITLLEAERGLNNGLRGFAKLRVAFE
ncbi:MAG: cytochrome P450 [Steroidobacteraceae bacterium]